MKPTHEIQVEFIKDCLRAGLKRNGILSKFANRWQDISTRTFDRRLKDAETSMQTELKAIATRTEESICKEVEARTAKILTSIERQEILTQIALGQIKLKKLIVCDGVIEEREVVSDWADRKNAIAELNRMDGSYAPVTADLTTGGQPIAPTTVAAVIQFDGKSIEILK